MMNSKQKIKNIFIHPVKRRIAKHYVAILKRFFSLKVIAITGSCGKTSTKEMVISILQLNGHTIGSYANIDPVYNIPTTILKCRPWTRYLVLEMGIEYPNEMDFYFWLVKPDISIVTNVSMTHTEFFGDEEGVYKEKRKIVHYLNRQDTAILNSDNEYTRKMKNDTKAKVIWFGKQSPISATNIIINKDLKTQFVLTAKGKRLSIMLPLLGKQFVPNALAAACVGLACGISLDSIKKGLESFEQPPHRMNVIKLSNGALVIDDGYNNNPKAARETLKTFREVSKGKRRNIVFGDMLELGEHSIQAHIDIGKDIGSIGVDLFIGVGRLSETVLQTALKSGKIKQYHHLNSSKDIYPKLKKYLTPDSVTLIKGSRKFELEHVVSRIINV